MLRQIGDAFKEKETCPSGRNTNVEEKSLCAKMCSERQDSLGLPKEQDLGGGGDSGLGEM